MAISVFMVDSVTQCTQTNTVIKSKDSPESFIINELSMDLEFTSYCCFIYFANRQTAINDQL